MQATVFPSSAYTHFAAGVAGSAVPWYAAQAILDAPMEQTFLVARNLQESERWLEETCFYLETVLNMPEVERLSFPDIPDSDADDPRVFDHLCDRIAVLTKLLHPGQTQRIIATTVGAFFDRCPDPAGLTQHELHIKCGEEIALHGLVDRLGNELEYASEAVCEQPGQFAQRGGILDIYPLNADQPYRIDFFGDEVESIRPFDPATQRTLEDPGVKTDLIIASGRAGASNEQDGGITAFLTRPTRIFLLEPELLAEHHPNQFYNSPTSREPNWSWVTQRIKEEKAPVHFVGISELSERPKWFQAAEERSIQAEDLVHYRQFPADDMLGTDRFDSEQEARLDFLEKTAAWQQDGFEVSFVLNTEGEQQRLKEILQQETDLKKFKPTFLRGILRHGVIVENTDLPFPLAARSKSKGWVFATDTEIFGRNRRRIAKVRQRSLPQKNRMDQALDFSELADGDPVVHLQNGICLYRGLTQVEIKGHTEEAISLEFANDVILHLPLHESHLLTRYVGLSKTEPKLGKLGSGNWDKTRRAAEQATLDLAGELLRLQAARDAEQGFSFPDDSDWQNEFEHSFLYRETPDQLTAIQETKQDMQRTQPMDRLICGDVGFGKTEVAIRAAFKAVNAGKQVAILVPTTVLCQQHFNTFRERMADYPVTVEMVSRFRGSGQNSQVIQQAAAGQIDILIGTHRLLSGDVSFKDLGLLVIDEEQRFGVRHKERLKQMRLTVDILTLSATPIPRTLYMALVGAREMSVIETAPVDRLPVQTIVKGFDANLIKSAIRQEINRGGQIFYLHNRVGTIDRAVELIEQLIPDARIGVGHGQMDEGMLERVMSKFVAHKYDVLVCTTIIESGIDIPNCNTIIIENAERFGLAQLYQIRGRVGRHKRQAYAYLLTNERGKMMDEARKRLSAIRQYNKLGSGYRIAMRDLELRGAGNLLGSEQSGHIAGVGFDLYCQLLRQSVARLKGDKQARIIRAKVQFDCVIVGARSEKENQTRSAPGHEGFSAIKMADLKEELVPSVQAFLPHSYISESRLRIDLYRRLATADTPENVRAIADEMKDRFGALPQPVKVLLHLTEVRTLAEQAGVDKVVAEGTRLKCRLAQAGSKESFIMLGKRFPRLTGKDALSRVREVKAILKRHTSAT